MSAPIRYNTPDANGWKYACDDIFLAQFRGKPCEVCGEINGTVGRSITRSCGHHIAEKDNYRLLRYDPRIIVVLCPDHHGRFSAKLSPHSTDTLAQGRFYFWLFASKMDQWLLTLDLAEKKWDKSWTYREMYERLGGEIKGELVKDMKPHNHRASVKRIENNQGE